MSKNRIHCNTFAKDNDRPMQMSFTLKEDTTIIEGSHSFAIVYIGENQFQTDIPYSELIDKQNNL